MSNYTNKTTEELNNLITYREEDVNKMRNKLCIFGKVLGEDSTENVVAMIYAMHEDASRYKWYLSELDELYAELERRKNEDAESD